MMPSRQFDPSAFFEFDMHHGAVRARGGKRVLVLTEDVLSSLLVTAVRNGDLTAVRKLGTQLGALVVDSLGEQGLTAAPRQVLDHACGVLALYGWGTLHIERWGAALVLVVQDAAPLDEDKLALAALLGGLFSEIASREVACVPVGTSSRYLVVDPGIAEQVWAWSRDGEGIAAIVDRLEVAEGAEGDAE